MALNEKYDQISWTQKHYVFVEKVGPFQQNAQAAWKEVTHLKGKVSEHNDVVGAFAMYKVGPQIYRAGLEIKQVAKSLPDGLRYELVEGGNFIRFRLHGSYVQLPEACGRVFEIVERNDMKPADRFFVESYVNDPGTTPEEKLLTEILVPID